MLRRSGRIILLLVIIAVTAVVVWRATTNEIARARTRAAAQQVDVAAADAIYLLADLRASLHALPAPGQGSDFWAERAATQIEDIRARITTIEPTAAAANVSLADTLTALDTVATRTRQAAVLAGDGRTRDASSIVFSDARELIESMTANLDDVRQTMSR
ncbi:MAG: hypothetical protein IT178_17365, partial [Acidobacteria bacterium]|nr:hypothetical protein [Acidobacteriota bacterium]